MKKQLALVAILGIALIAPTAVKASPSPGDEMPPKVATVSPEGHVYADAVPSASTQYSILEVHGDNNVLRISEGEGTITPVVQVSLTDGTTYYVVKRAKALLSKHRGAKSTISLPGHIEWPHYCTSLSLHIANP